MKAKIALLSLVLFGSLVNVESALAQRRQHENPNVCSISQHMSPDGRQVMIVRYCEGGGLEILDIIAL